MAAPATGKTDSRKSERKRNARTRQTSKPAKKKSSYKLKEGVESDLKKKLPPPDSN